MNYRYSLLLLLSTILLLTVSFSYFHHKKNAVVSNGLLEAIPAASPVILTFSNVSSVDAMLQELNSNSLLAESPVIERFNDQYNVLSELFDLGDGNGNSEIIASIMATGASDYNFLYLTTYPGLDIYSESAYNYFSEEGFKIRESEFRNERILDLVKGDQQIHIFQEKQILAISFSSVPVEASVVALKEGKYSFAGNMYSNELLMSEDEEVGVLVLYEHLATFFPMLLNDEYTFLKKSIGDFAHVSVFNMHVSQNTVSFFGKTISEGKRGDSLLSEKRISDLNKVIPANTGLMQLNQVQDRQMKVEEYGYFKNWISGLYAHIVLETFTKEIDKASLLLIEIEDVEMAAEDLKELNGILGPEETYNYKDLEISISNLGGFIDEIFPNPIVSINPSAYTIIDGILVIASEQKNLKKFIDLYKMNQVLRYNPEYETFNSYLGDFASTYFYFNPSRAMEFSDRFWANRAPGKIGIQHSRSGKDLYTNIVLQRSGQDVFTVDELLWKTRLENTALENVHLVTNHLTKEKEALVQDAANKIYLIAQDGRKLWEKQLDDQIIGDVHQLDFLSNGKLQMLFTTDSMMYLLDRNGEFVSPYPIILPSRPVGGMTLVEYDLRSSYRVFIGGDNGNIYGYYKDGRPLPGWNPMKNIGRLAFPLQHVIVGQKDWLVAANEEGKIMMFNRKGEVRLPPIECGCKFLQPFQFSVKESMFTAVTTSDKGLFSFTSEGKYLMDNSVSFTDSLPAAFSMIDEKELLISMQDGELAIRDIAKASQRNYSIPYSDPKIIKSFELNGRSYIGIYSEVAGEIMLMDIEGNVVEDFPMKARAPFTLSNIVSTGESVLLATDKDGLFAYRLRL